MVTFLIMVIYFSLALRVMNLLFIPTQIGKPRKPYTSSEVTGITIGNLMVIAVMILVLVQLTGIQG